MIINLLANNGYIVLNKILMKKIGLYEVILIGELASEQIYWGKRNELITCMENQRNLRLCATTTTFIL